MFPVRLLIPVLLLCVGCASALKEPPKLSDIGSEPTRTSQATHDVTELLTAAEAAMAGAPDPVAIERARALYLEAASVPDSPAECFFGAARATAWLIEHEQDSQRREELATEGVQISQLCKQSHPDKPECKYRLALAVGQQARERPSTAVDGLDVMVPLLEDLIERAPELDHGGPHRVLALVLLRAPGWPSGPGDPELGLEHALIATTIATAYPPNQLVLGEALAEDGQSDEARLAIDRGLELARVAQEEGDTDAADWLRDGKKALTELR